MVKWNQKRQFIYFVWSRFTKHTVTSWIYPLEHLILISSHGPCSLCSILLILMMHAYRWSRNNKFVVFVWPDQGWNPRLNNLSQASLSLRRRVSYIWVKGQNSSIYWNPHMILRTRGEHNIYYSTVAVSFKRHSDVSTNRSI